MDLRHQFDKCLDHHLHWVVSSILLGDHFAKQWILALLDPVISEEKPKEHEMKEEQLRWIGLQTEYWAATVFTFLTYWMQKKIDFKKLWKLMLVMDRIRCIGPFSALHSIGSKPILNESVCEAIYFCFVVHHTLNRLLCQYMDLRYFYCFFFAFCFSSVDYSAWNLSTLRICVIDEADYESAHGLIKKCEHLSKSKINKR